jgi:hypothetical protein
LEKALSGFLGIDRRWTRHDIASNPVPPMLRAGLLIGEGEPDDVAALLAFDRLSLLFRHRPQFTARQQRLVDVALAAESEGRHLTRQRLGVAAGFGKGEAARVTATRTPHLAARPQRHRGRHPGDSAGDAADAYATLRFVARKARATRDRVIAAREVLGLARVAGEAAFTGPAVQVHIVLKDPVAAAQLGLLIECCDARRIPPG